MTNACAGIGRLTIVGVCVVLLASCESVKSKEIAQQAVDRFRSQVDSTQYHEIYIGADDELRKATNEADFIFFLQSVHRDLGRVERSRPRDFKIGWLGGRQIVSLTYDTQFTAGTGTEQFDWHFNNNRLLLFGYHVTPNRSSTSLP